MASQPDGHFFPDALSLSGPQVSSLQDLATTGSSAASLPASGWTSSCPSSMHDASIDQNQISTSCPTPPSIPHYIPGAQLPQLSPASPGPAMQTLTKPPVNCHPPPIPAIPSSKSTWVMTGVVIPYTRRSTSDAHMKSLRVREHTESSSPLPPALLPSTFNRQTTGPTSGASKFPPPSSQDNQDDETKSTRTMSIDPMDLMDSSTHVHPRTSHHQVSSISRRGPTAARVKKQDPSPVVLLQNTNAHFAYIKEDGRATAEPSLRNAWVSGDKSPVVALIERLDDIFGAEGLKALWDSPNRHVSEMD